MYSEELPQMELEWEDGARRINECKYLYIDSVRELEELTLELIVTEVRHQTFCSLPHCGRSGSRSLDPCSSLAPEVSSWRSIATGHSPCPR